MEEKVDVLGYIFRLAIYFNTYKAFLLLRWEIYLKLSTALVKVLSLLSDLVGRLSSHALLPCMSSLCLLSESKILPYFHFVSEFSEVSLFLLLKQQLHIYLLYCLVPLLHLTCLEYSCNMYAIFFIDIISHCICFQFI